MPGADDIPDGDGDIRDYYENAPCGHVLAWPDGRIAGVNATLADWLGQDRAALLGRPFTDLLTVGGGIHYETHFAPLLQMQGQISGIAVDLKTADGTRLPVFVTANVKTGADGNPALVRITAQDASDRRSYERELLDARQRADRERARVQVLATTLQRSLLPPLLFPPDGLETAAYYHPESDDEVGGDFYDLFPLASQKWGFFLGDVSGKGPGAAAVTSLTRYTLRAAAVFDDDPVAVLHNLDTVLRPEFHSDDPRFCTVIFGVLTKADNGFDVALAAGGHPPALFLGADGAVRYVETDGGHPIGLIAQPRFVSRQFHLGPGDTLVLYTDGLTEARTGVGVERYDDQNALLDFAAGLAPGHAADIVDGLRALLVSFGSGLQDDAAVLALGVPAG
jgi:sigma-B regulation protein RsbU (phosphoserine phosphatase)